MQIHTLLLDLFASIALISAVMVIISKNPIHSVVFLILVFCNATGLLILLKMEFIAMMFLIIYVGAIAVLFLFVVMMLNIKVNELGQTWPGLLPIGGIISAIFLLEIFLILDSDFIPLLNSKPSQGNFFDFNGRSLRDLPCPSQPSGWVGNSPASNLVDTTNKALSLDALVLQGYTLKELSIEGQQLYSEFLYTEPYKR